MSDKLSLLQPYQLLAKDLFLTIPRLINLSELTALSDSLFSFYWWRYPTNRSCCIISTSCDKQISCHLANQVDAIREHVHGGSHTDLHYVLSHGTHATSNPTAMRILVINKALHILLHSELPSGKGNCTVSVTTTSAVYHPFLEAKNGKFMYFFLCINF
jgi:hypothetical protein